ncbi:MAG: hypothetical protein RLZZ488_2017 [Pseudomonadota bacterium]|jgi:Rod binding domain-containing protein
MSIQTNSVASGMTNAILPQDGAAGAKRANNVVSDELLRKRQDAEKAAQEFETMFVDMMVKSMRQTAQPEEMSNAEDIYQGMLDSEYSKSMTSANNFGIREQILNWMEQADPSLKEAAVTNEKSSINDTNTTASEQARLQNEMWALKAASQAYQLSGQSR